MTKPTDWTPGTRYAGYNGHVVVDDMAVKITREGLGRVASRGSGTVRLERDEVKIEHRPATRLCNGLVRPASRVHCAGSTCPHTGSSR